MKIIDDNKIDMKNKKKINENFNYKWGSWVAEIRKHPRRNVYTWWVGDENGDDIYDFYNHQDIYLLTPLQAENDMFSGIYDRIGHSPKRQIRK